jgi:gluconate 2-dehydrogenase alpha chain
MKTMKEVDVVLVGAGWTGGILGKEFSEAGMTVVCLERGGPQTASEDFTVPRMRDELALGIRNGMMVNTADQTETIRNNGKETALPYRRLGSYLMGTGVGGASTHWNGHTWRWDDNEFKIRTRYEEKYGKKCIPEDMTIQDWGVTYKELEKYYDKFEKTAGISGEAGFRFSGPMKRSSITWDDKNLTDFLRAPQEKVPGNRMPFSGMPDEAALKAVVQYLQTASK